MLKLMTRVVVALSITLAAATARSQPCSLISTEGLPTFEARGEVVCTTMHDPDGSGPMPAQLVVGGEFTSIGGVAARNIAMWDGQHWSALGAGLTARVRCLATWDSDGPDGPLPPRIHAGGVWPPNPGSASGPNGVLAFDGTQWSQVGDLGTWVETMVVADLDGDGPQFPRLCVGAQDSPSLKVRFATAWLPIAGTASVFGQVSAMTTWDPDGSGPTPARLVVAGNLNLGRVLIVDMIAQTVTPALSPGSASTPHQIAALTTWDPDGDGPEPASLIAAGDSGAFSTPVTTSVARWNSASSSWEAMGAGTPALSVSSLASVDLDADGPALTRLFAGGSSAVGLGAVGALAEWTGTHWVGVPRGPEGPVHVLQEVRADQSASMFIGGAFATLADAAPTVVNGAAVLDDTGIHALANGGAWGGMVSVTSMTHWDPDGPGPGPRLLAAAGQFDLVDGQPGRVAIYDGQFWTALPARLDGAISSIAAWDPDGDGPEPELLIVSGTIVRADGAPSAAVVSFDRGASTWGSMGGGALVGPARRVLSFDHDEDHRTPSQLILSGAVAGGQFQIMHWSGSGWVDNLGNRSFLWSGYLLALHDPDGSGPQHPRMCTQAVANGRSTFECWDGASWSELPDPPAMVFNFESWDQDGDGPNPPVLAASGNPSPLSLFLYREDLGWVGPELPLGSWSTSLLASFAPALGSNQVLVMSGGANSPTAGTRYSTFDGDKWRVVMTGIPGEQPTMFFATGVGAPSGSERLLAATSGPSGRKVLHWLGLPTTVNVVDPPAVVRVRRGGSVTLTGSASGSGTLRYAWVKNGSWTSSGAGGLYSPTPELTLLNATTSTEGLYALFATDDCSGVYASPTRVLLTCLADTDASGVVSVQDLLDYISLYLAGDPMAEIDGFAGVTMRDLFAYITAYFAPCT